MKSTTLLAVLIATAATAQAQYSALHPHPAKQPGLSTPAATGGFLAGTDDCAAPHTNAGIGDMSGVPFVTGTTGTTGQSEGSCYFFGLTGIDADVWFDWTAAQSGTGRVSTCNGTGVDTKVAVWPDASPASCPTAGTSLACNDDACGLQSTAVWTIAPGTTYTIQLGTFPGASGGVGTFDVIQQSPIPCGQYDDGTTENALGLTAGGEMGWMHAYDCLSEISGIETAYGTMMFPGSCMNGAGSQVGLWVDLDCDSDPTTGMQLLEVVQTTVVNCGTGILNPISFTTSHTIVSGCSWIAASADHTAGQFPGPMDQDNPTPAAWIVGSTAGPGTLDYSNLGANNVPPMQMSAIGFPTAWLLRAQGVAGCGDTLALCYGDGSAAPCGCGNEASPGSCGGCANGLGIGAVLSTAGSASLSNDTLVLTADGVTAQPGLMFQGDTFIAGGSGVTFGDGIRCCGQNVVRLEVLFGAQPEPTSVSSTVVISQHPGQNLMPGDVRCYQYWYRDPAGSPCGSSFNLSNAQQILWGL